MPGEIPTLTRAELEALQLDRLRDSLRRAYDHVPHYRRAFTDAGVTPDDLHTLADLARFPFTAKADLRANYPFGMFAVPREQVAPGARLQRHDRQADRRRLHPRGHRHLGGADGALDPRRRGRARRPRARRLRLRAVHRRARRPLRRGAARLHGGAGQRRHDRAAGPADRRLRAAGHHGDPVVLPGDPRRDGGAGRRPAHRPASRSASSAPSRGPTRCGARSRSGPRSAPSTSTGSPR